MIKSKLTPWFKNQKPYRIGVYQQRSGLYREIGYQRWDGKLWFSWCKTPEEAAREPWPACVTCQNDPWRGLAEKPS